MLKLEIRGITIIFSISIIFIITIFYNYLILLLGKEKHSQEFLPTMLSCLGLVYG